MQLFSLWTLIAAQVIPSCYEITSEGRSIPCTDMGTLVCRLFSKAHFFRLSGHMFLLYGDKCAFLGFFSDETTVEVTAIHLLVLE